MTEGFNRNNNPNQKPPNVLNEYGLRLTGEPIQNSKRAPSMMMNVKRDGKAGPWCVYLEARTGVEDDKDYGKIPFMLDMPTAYQILDMVIKAADSAAAGAEPSFDRMEISNRRFLRNQNAWSKEPMVDGTIAVGWTASGQVYIGIKSWDASRPNCKFVLRPVVDFRRSVKLFKKDGTAWEDGPLSQSYARGWARSLAELVTATYASEFVPPPPREQQGGNGGNNYGGGGNRGGGNNYGGNRGGETAAPSSGSGGDAVTNGGWSEDDIPM